MSSQTQGRFRLKRGDIEVEFEGEAREASRRFDSMFEWLRGPAAAPAELAQSGSVTDVKKPTRKTGETKVIKERLGALKSQAFFKGPKELSEVRKDMQTRGWYHESWSIQPVLLRYAQELGIKRIKEEGRYKYVES